MLNEITWDPNLYINNQQISLRLLSFCTGPAAGESTCVNKIYGCDLLANAGECTKPGGTMATFCKKTCGLCGGSPCTCTLFID